MLSTTGLRTCRLTLRTLLTLGSQYPARVHWVFTAACLGCALFLGRADAAQSEYASAPLKERRLEPFSVAIPEWKVEQESDLGENGKIKLQDPQGEGRFLSILWNPGRTTVDEAFPPSAMLKAGLARLPTFDSVVRGTNVAIERFATTGETKRLAAAFWYCKDSNTTVLVSSFINSDWDGNAKLIGRILATIRCNAPQSGDQRLLPAVPPPNGYRRAESSEGIAYTNDRGAIWFSAPWPQSRVMKEPGGAAELLGSIAQKKFSLTKVHLDAKAEYRGDRAVWVGAGKLPSGLEVSVAAVYWECDTPARAYVGAYAGSVESVASGIAILTSARCR